jgi:tetratricopeptide (TPR) repeat protein
MTPELRRRLLAARAAELSSDWAAAAECYRDALPLLPDDHRLLANLGNALWLSDQPTPAREAYELAVTLAPSEPLPLRGLGNALRDLGAFEQADHAYTGSLALADDPLTAWNHSQLLLGLERYEDAFTAAERRLELAAMLPFRPGPYAHEHSTLRGEASAEPLHLWSEQGLGDTLQYVRWFCLIGQQPNAVHLEVEHQLVRLFQHGLHWLPHPPQVLAKPADGSAVSPITDAQLPLMSLPFHLGGAPLAGEAPYLRHASWQASAEDRPYPRIGLVWAAGRKLDDPFTAREYHKRSLPPQALGALVEGLHLAGAQLVNLQLGPDRDAALPLASRFAEAIPENADFADTAALVRQLDLVISVDTAMAHLAGALGHPAWILLPWSADPRWLRERSDSPWYPSLRLWRQPRSGDWLAVVDALLQALPAWWQELRRAL